MASQGPRFPGTAASLANAGTSENSDAWVNPGNVGADDGTTASITAATYDTPDISQLLVASNFGFDIPKGSHIDGITVEVERNNAAGAASDNRVQLAKGTVFALLVGTNKADTALDWPAALTIATYGGAADTWNAGLTPADVNSPGFAVMLSVQADAANTDVAIDFIRVTVAYTEPTWTRHVQASFPPKNKMPRWPHVLAADFTGPGALPITYAKAGSGVSGYIGSGSDAVTFAETGAGVAHYVGAGADAFTGVESGTGIANYVGAGAKVREHAAKTGAGVSGYIGAGADAATFAETGTGIANYIGAGSDAATFVESGTGILHGVGSGVGVKGGGVTYTKAGTAVAGFVGAGADAATFVESGTGVITGIGAGAKVRERLKVGTGISGYIGAGTRARELQRSGMGIAAFRGSGADAFTAQETGSGIANHVAAGTKAIVYSESGTGIITFAGSGTSQFVTATVFVDFFDPPSPLSGVDAGSPEASRFDSASPESDMDAGSPESERFDVPTPGYA